MKWHRPMQDFVYGEDFCPFIEEPTGSEIRRYHPGNFFRLAASQSPFENLTRSRKNCDASTNPVAQPEGGLGGSNPLHYERSFIFYCLVIEQKQWLINTSRRRHDVFNIETCALFPKSLTSRTDHLFRFSFSVRCCIIADQRLKY